MPARSRPSAASRGPSLSGILVVVVAVLAVVARAPTSGGIGAGPQEPAAARGGRAVAVPLYRLVVAGVVMGRVQLQRGRGPDDHVAGEYRGGRRRAGGSGDPGMRPSGATVGVLRLLLGRVAPR